MAVGTVMESTMWAVGNEDKADEWAWILGVEMMTGGDWDGARRYLQETLNSPSFSNGGALAWLESDPEKAARLLDLSCRKNNVFSLINAVELTRATGSDALTEHYLTRLRLQAPERAQEYED